MEAVSSVSDSAQAKATATLSPSIHADEGDDHVGCQGAAAPPVLTHVLGLLVSGCFDNPTFSLRRPFITSRPPASPLDSAENISVVAKTFLEVGSCHDAKDL